MKLSNITVVAGKVKATRVLTVLGLKVAMRALVNRVSQRGEVAAVVPR